MHNLQQLSDLGLPSDAILISRAGSHAKAWLGLPLILGMTPRRVRMEAKLGALGVAGARLTVTQEVWVRPPQGPPSAPV